MRKLIVTAFVSLDGVVEAPGGEPGHPHTGWVIDYMGPEQIANKLQETLDAESLLIGRVTYESFAEAWPPRTGPLADKMNAMPKTVVSTTLRDPAWNNCTVIASDVAKAVADLKVQEGGPILVVGSQSLAAMLITEGLVDELRLMIVPVLLGCGRRLFPETGIKSAWRLASSLAYDTGVLVQTYRPA